VTTYDPDVDPPAHAWLAMDEDERIAAVETYHRLHRIPSPQPRLHATIHTVVENQLAIGEQVVIDALGRLRSDGLTRHEAVHAIGMVVAEQIFDLLKTQSAPGPAVGASYLDRVRQLTADQWRESGDER